MWMALDPNCRQAPTYTVGGAVTGLAAGATDPVRQTLWQLAAGFFELQAGGHLEPDLFAKRVSSRWLSDLKSLAKGQALAPDRLAKDMLFHLAHVQAWDEAQYPRAKELALESLATGV